MPVLSKLTAFATLALSGAVVALPWDATSKLATHRSHIGTRDVTFTGYHPETVYETFEDGLEHETERGVTVTSTEAAVNFLQSKLGLSKDDLKARTGFDGETASHVYLRQKINGIEVANGVANVAFNRNQKIIAYGSSFVKPKNVASATPTLTAKKAITLAEEHLGGKYNQHPTRLEYVLKDNDHAVLTHVVQVEHENGEHWYEAFIDAKTGEIVNLVDFVAQVAYRVIPFNKNDPTTGFSLVTDPADTTASPNGWHKVGSTTYTTTQGNNVVAYKGTTATSGQSAQTSSGQVFDYTWNSAVSPTTSPNVDVARVNAFYVINSMHDLTYKYGFTEKAYNFQAENFGKGGAGNDHVTIHAQASGSNNANFATPADGQSGRCNMYTWTYTTPNRDGDLENDIIVHEMTHGVTNRMTGGGTGRCLQTTEAGGMGEGWSDAGAFFTQQKSSTIVDYVLGAWVTNKPGGIRLYPYSINKSTNPHMYSTLKTQTEVHRIGEVWATMLFELHAALIQQDGFSATILNPDQTAGNIKYFHLVMDALSLQPCNPTFISARNAIIQADVNRYAGANKCLIWKAFAKRGLGVSAASYNDDTSVPSGC
ncbi:hypothetical protein FRC02_004015 [Tulasnella sp. 418]|nr:hypothetical protein FRC02_004015 [Tulasnella sp. 418]